MSLLMKALKSVERGPGAPAGSGPGPEPRERAADAPPRPAQAAADLIRAHEGDTRRRLWLLVILLGLVVAGLAAYFYVAVYMPWLLAAGSIPFRGEPAAPVPAARPSEPLPVAVPLPPSAAPEPPPAAVRPRSPASAAPPAGKRAPAAGGGGRPEPLVRPAPAEATGMDDLAAAHGLLAAGHLAQARQAYERLRLIRPDHPDVWLGLAVIAQAEGQTEEAARLYARVLELDGHNVHAQAGLTTLTARAQPAAAEARLRQLIAQQPAAYLYFELGNLLAAQARWHEAQQAYFEAHRLEPDVADHAFNLAVSLEHLDQPRAAAEYYRRALQLAQQHPATAHFDSARAQDRLDKLSP